MKLLHYLKIENFKKFGEIQHIELDHPSVLVGPNNCGKTSAIQAIALWSQAVKSWYQARKESTAKERTATPLNRLNITAVPVQNIRYFWHNTKVASGQNGVPMSIAVGLFWKEELVELKMKFRYRGEEVVYCLPDDDVISKLDFLEHAAKLNVELLYPMSGLTTEEPILKAGRINVLLGRGETAQVLRNLCLIVAKDNPADWARIVELMKRLFSIDLDEPRETALGTIDIFYRQPEVKEPLDISMSGRGLQQLLLIFSYLYSHKGSVLLIDEPDAHLEILRQKQIYVLLREIAFENKAQVILVTHSEVILNESLDRNLTLLLEGRADNLATSDNIRNALKFYGAEHYVKARERGYVLYVEGGTDVDILLALAKKTKHPVLEDWDQRINVYYVQDNYPEPSLEKDLERVEGGFGVTAQKHFFSLRDLLPGLRGLGILDNDGKGRLAFNDGGLNIVYWTRYEAENYFITPQLLSNFARNAYQDQELFGAYQTEIQDVLDVLTREQIFSGSNRDFTTYKEAEGAASRLIWSTKTERIKLSSYAEEFFRRVAERLSQPMLLRKGEFHRLVEFVDPDEISEEVRDKLTLLRALFSSIPKP
jgi:predicted ATPase